MEYHSMLLSLQRQGEVKMRAGEGTKKDSELEDQGRRLGDHLEGHGRVVWSGTGRGRWGARPGTSPRLPGVRYLPERRVPAVWCMRSCGCGDHAWEWLGLRKTEKS